jgi:hypothetical protein
MNVLEMQNAIISKGYVFVEQTFPNGDVSIHFKETDEFNPYKDYDGCYRDEHGWKLGWGRFQRERAWRMAYEWIVLGKREE